MAMPTSKPGSGKQDNYSDLHGGAVWPADSPQQISLPAPEIQQHLKFHFGNLYAMAANKKQV